MTCSLSSPGSASNTPSVTMISRSPSQSFRDNNTGSACSNAPAGTYLPSKTWMPSCPITKAPGAPSLNISRAPVYRSIQPASRAAGCCYPPASKSTVFTSLKAERGAKPVSNKVSSNSTIRLLSRLASAPQPIPSHRLNITWLLPLSQKL